MKASQTHEGRQTKRSHKGNRTIWDVPEAEITRAQVTDHKARQQRTHARTQRQANASDSEGCESANRATNKDREPQHHEIDGQIGGNDRTNYRSRSLHSWLWANNAQQIAALQHNACGDRDLLTTTAQRSQIAVQSAPKPGMGGDCILYRMDTSRMAKTVKIVIQAAANCENGSA